MSTALPFELRIHSLEAKIYGARPEDNSAGVAGSTRSIQARLRDIEEALERASQSSDALKRLMDGCEFQVVHIYDISADRQISSTCLSSRWMTHGIKL
jgi:hypothetical protein